MTQPTLTGVLNQTGNSSSPTSPRIGGADVGTVGKWIWVCVLCTGAVTLVPPGFTLVDQVGVSTSRNLYVYRRAHAGGGEPGSHTWNTDTSGRWVTIGFLTEDADPTAPVDVVDVDNSEVQNVTNIDAPSITPTQPDDLLVWFGGILQVCDITPPTGYTEPVNGEKKAASTLTAAIAYKLATDSSPTGVVSGTGSIAGANAGIHLAIKGVSEGGGEPTPVSSSDSGTLSVTESSSLSVPLTSSDTDTITGSHVSTVSADITSTDITYQSLDVQSPGYHLEYDVDTGAVGSLIAGGEIAGAPLYLVETSTLSVSVDSSDSASMSGDGVSTLSVSVDSSDSASISGDGVSTVNDLTGVSTTSIESSDSSASLALTESSSISVSVMSSDSGTLAVTHGYGTSAEISQNDNIQIDISHSNVSAAQINALDTLNLIALLENAIFADVVSSDTGVLTGSEVSDTDDVLMVGPLSATFQTRDLLTAVFTYQE